MLTEPLHRSLTQIVNLVLSKEGRHTIDRESIELMGLEGDVESQLIELCDLGYLERQPINPNVGPSEELYFVTFQALLEMRSTQVREVLWRYLDFVKDILEKDPTAKHYQLRDLIDAQVVSKIPTWTQLLALLHSRLTDCSGPQGPWHLPQKRLEIKKCRDIEALIPLIEKWDREDKEKRAAGCQAMFDAEDVLRQVKNEILPCKVVAFRLCWSKQRLSNAVSYARNEDWIDPLPRDLEITDAGRQQLNRAGVRDLAMSVVGPAPAPGVQHIYHPGANVVQTKIENVANINAPTVAVAVGDGATNNNTTNTNNVTQTQYVGALKSARKAIVDDEEAIDAIQPDLSSDLTKLLKALEQIQFTQGLMKETLDETWAEVTKGKNRPPLPLHFQVMKVLLGAVFGNGAYDALKLGVG